MDIFVLHNSGFLLAQVGNPPLPPLKLAGSMALIFSIISAMLPGGMLPWLAVKVCRTMVPACFTNCSATCTFCGLFD